jgi:hypothetical protein
MSIWSLEGIRLKREGTVEVRGRKANIQVKEGPLRSIAPRTERNNMEKTIWRRVGEPPSWIGRDNNSQE